VHAPETARPKPATLEDADGALSFLWLELTGRCNLQCVHCYTESDPWSGHRDLLSAEDYEDVMSQAYALGCRQVQLIGGEPQLNPSFDRLLRRSVEIGFEFVEVFSNLTRLSGETLDFSAGNGIHFATSVYSDDPAVHDAVTRVSGSHRRTINSLRRLVERGVPTRAGVITMGDDPEAAERTLRFLRDLGVGSVRTSPVREFGRGEEVVGRSANLSGLCGHCWAGSLALAPDGSVFPCVMARDWAVGDVASDSLAAILRGDALTEIRREIHETVWQPRASDDTCDPYCMQSCEPDLSCPCDPLLCQQSCSPWDAVTKEE
jgi:sulfatase maturation enzyme AslB (radical SAM superfamily)